MSVLTAAGGFRGMKQANERHSPFIVAMFAIWLLAVGAGLALLWAYASKPGPAAHAPTMWPRSTLVMRDPARPTLVMFLHPQCGCSRASLGELALLMAHTQTRVSARVLFYRPAEETAGWERTDLWTAASIIPGVSVASDVNAEQAAIFGAAVSGETLLYDAGGRLIFSGGLTAARGHSGDNAGRTTLVSFLTRGVSPLPSTPVFGCFLREQLASVR